MGDMTFVNNKMKRWALVRENTAVAKNKGAAAAGGWAGAVPIGTKNAAGRHVYRKSGKLGSVELQVSAIAQSEQCEIVDPEEIKLFEDSYGKDTPKKFVKVKSLQVFVPQPSIRVDRAYTLDARVARIAPYNVGKGKANWGSVRAYIEIDWSDMVSTETTKLNCWAETQAGGKISVVFR